MAMLRRDFLKRLTLTAAGLLVADDVLELLAPPKRLWVGADFGTVRQLHYQGDALTRMWRKVHVKIASGWPVHVDEWEWKDVRIVPPEVAGRPVEVLVL